MSVQSHKKAQQQLLKQLERCTESMSLCRYLQVFAAESQELCEHLKDSIRNHIKQKWKPKMAKLKYKILSIEDIFPEVLLQHTLSFLDSTQQFIICNVSKTFKTLALQSIKMDGGFDLRCEGGGDKIECKIMNGNFESDFFSFEKGVKYLPIMSHLSLIDFNTADHRIKMIETFCNPKMLSHIYSIEFRECEFLVFSEFLKKCAIRKFSNDDNKHIFTAAHVHIRFCDFLKF